MPIIEHRSDDVEMFSRMSHRLLNFAVQTIPNDGIRGSQTMDQNPMQERYESLKLSAEESQGLLPIIASTNHNLFNIISLTHISNLIIFISQHTVNPLVRPGFGRLETALVAITP